MIEIIPAIDIIDGRCVRLSQGDYDRVSVYASKPGDMARMMVDAGCRRVHAVDLDGAKAGRPVNLMTLETLANVDGVEIEWGGGLKTDDDLRSAFNAGMSYAVAGSVAARQPARFVKWLTEYGADRVVLGADARDGLIAVAGWLEEEQLTVDELVEKYIKHGLSQAIVTDISKDGMLGGPSTELYVRLQKRFPAVSFTVSGGISSIADIEMLDRLGLRRVIVGKALYEGKISLADIERLNTKP